ncbi:hypothetical protein [Candidatus Harpocratesius sp.]
MKYKDLTPSSIWAIFEEIYGKSSNNLPVIPIHQRIKRWIVKKNQKYHLNLLISEDSLGNIFITKPATPGFERYPPILLQAHYDLATTPSNSTQEMLTSTIHLDPPGTWFEIIGTPLLDDSVVGVGLILTVLTDKSGNLQHGPIEALFTVKKNGQFIGALNLDPTFFNIQSHFLLNFDAVDIASIINGAAGCSEFVFWKSIKLSSSDSFGSLNFYHIRVSGLQGGELGSEIHFFRANALKIIARCLISINSEYSVYIGNWKGGELYRFIPQSSDVWFALSSTDAASAIEILHDEIRRIIRKFKRFSEYGQSLEPDLQIIVEESKPFLILDATQSAEILSLAAWIPQGLIQKTAVENEAGKISNNFARIRFLDNKIELSCKSRGDNQSELQAFNRTLSCAQYFGWNVINDYNFPVWEPTTPGTFLHLVKHIYEDRLNHPVRVNRSYWVLEPGVIALKFPHMQALSIGPTEIGVYPSNYKVQVHDVQILYDVMKSLLFTLKDLAE